MRTKLTISLDKNVIEQAKLMAKKKGRSLSEMIESYLKVMVQKPTSETEISADIKRLQGSVKLPVNMDYKKALQQSLNKKYQS